MQCCDAIVKRNDDNWPRPQIMGAYFIDDKNAFNTNVYEAPRFPSRCSLSTRFMLLSILVIMSAYIRETVCTHTVSWNHCQPLASTRSLKRPSILEASEKSARSLRILSKHFLNQMMRCQPTHHDPPNPSIDPGKRMRRLNLLHTKCSHVMTLANVMRRRCSCNNGVLAWNESSSSKCKLPK